MTAGLNLQARIWDMKYDLGQGDDSIGGAQPSGTVIYSSVDCRISANRPTQPLLEQGIEDISTFVGVFSPHTLLISNNNQVEVIAPPNSSYYGDFFRVIGDVQRSSMSPSDSRGYLLVNLKRVEKSRSIQ